ncbi:ribosomal maturation YjgA family protein [Microbacterium plantarum]|uniref:ribosomal maturation YjgA family protein n=1 Tax=Microbacterium plantarum TaxID=1816425 RepID=UPI002B45B4FA|nr:DUF2809 domain-containing protein [Microbacterium plantarum]WRK16812.1 DUF2809 domain-containing protein [Microbacterium plantarum]
MTTGRAARRWGAAALAVAVVAAGLVVHGILPDTAATDIAGDALYAVLIYALVVAVAPRAGTVVVAAVAGGWCIAVELLQLSDLPARAATVFPPAVLVLGTVFDARDLLVYVVTIVITGALDAVWRRRRAPSSPPR